jgi:isoleucyl-tRNA synthetase
VLSRQRAWGVPLTAFVEKASGAVLRDARVNARIIAAIESEGADVWFTSDAARFLAPDFDPAAYDKAEDILDVWFDSGSSHAFVLEARADLCWPADLYLEGSDQHRGWFHSSLLESCATRGRAPYRAVLTHGFVLDEKGRKMSKSLGNVVAPQEVVEQNGAEILRLWVASSDFAKDLLLGPDILRANVDSYRKLRNTLRFLLGNLDGFTAAERLEAAAMPELERFMLHRLAVLDAAIRRGYDDFDLPRVFGLLFNFCTVELSAFYFDIRKDALYCDGLDSPRRRAACTVLDHLFSCLTAWLAPILAFTAEEAWLSRFPSESDSVHLRLFPDLPAAWRDEALAARWEIVRQVRRVVTGALEIERREKRIGASLEAAPVLHVEDAAWRRALAGLDLAEIAITSQLRMDAGPIPAGAFSLPDLPGVAVSPALAEGTKCARCWLILPEVEENGELCHRCQAVLRDRALAAVASAGR